MAERIEVCDGAVVVLESGDHPATICDVDDLFIRADEDGNFLVWVWDGCESHLAVDEPFETLEAAREAAVDCFIDMMGY